MADNASAPTKSTALSLAQAKKDSPNKKGAPRAPFLRSLKAD